MIAVALALSCLHSLGLLDPYDWRHGLYSSVRDGHVAHVRFLLAVFPQLLDEKERYTKRPLTPLQLAADRKQLAVMKVLLERGADPRTSGSWGTALQIAAREGHSEAAELLLANGAVLDLDSAVMLDRRDEVRRVLRLADMIGIATHVANRRIDHAWAKEPLLHAASTRGHTEMAKLLLRYGADPTARVIEIPCFISDINHKGETVGLTPAGTNTPDLDVPIRKR